MDPNETLRRLRLLCQPGAEAGDPDGAELSELFLALDEWLSKGGFLPWAWMQSGHVSASADAPGRVLDPLGPPNPAHGKLPEGSDH